MNKTGPRHNTCTGAAAGKLEVVDIRTDCVKRGADSKEAIMMPWVYMAMAGVFVLGGCLGTLLSALMFAAAENNR
jgi:hypothetical protein